MRLPEVCIAAMSALLMAAHPPVSHGQSALDLHRPIPGGSVVIVLGAFSTPKPVVKFGQRRILVKRHENQWIALLGLSQDTVPGRYIVSINHGEDESSIRDFLVKPHRYPVNQAVEHARRREAAGRKAQPLLSGKKQHLVELASLWSEELTAELPLATPVDGAQVGAYGTRWVKGDEIGAPTEHVEFQASPGAVVLAPGAGRICALLPLDDTELAVCIDHGMGLLSMIGPIERVDIKEGARIERAAALGRLAKDPSVQPRVSWYLALNQEFIDPMNLVRKH